MLTINRFQKEGIPMRDLMRQLSLAMMTVLIASLIAASGANAETSPRDLKAMSGASYIYIATVRKDGNQSKAVPVWFLTSKDNSLLIQTSPTSWKAKRIRRGSPAMIWIGTSDGPALIAKAEIVTDKDSQQEIIDGIPRKYTLARLGFARPSDKKFSEGKIVAIRITPARDLPEGFKSQPGTPAPSLEAK